MPHIRAAGSVAPCFDLPLSQRMVSSPSIVLSQCGRSKVPTAQLHHSSRIYIFHLYMAHTSVSTTVVYYLQSKLPTHQSANITVHCTQNEKTNHSTVSVLVSIIKQWLSGAQWTGMDVEGSGHSLSEVLLQHLPEATGKSQWKSVRLAGAMDKFHTRYYHLNQPLQ